MNKARITYRFDPSREWENRSGGNGTGEPARVIPLTQEEYQVVDEHTDHGRAMEPGRRNREGGYLEEEPQQGQPFGGGRDGAEYGEPRQRTSYRGESRQGNTPPVEPPHKRQEREIRDYQPLNQYTTDFGAWSSPFDAETQRIEDLIRESNEREGRKPLGEPEFYRPAPPSRRDEDSEGQYPHNNPRQSYPYRQQPEYEPGSGYRDERPVNWEGPVVTGERYVRHNRTPWLKISAAIAGAAVTGVLLGFLALSLFNSPDTPASPADVVADGTTPTQNVLPVTGKVENTDSTAKSATAVSSGKEVAMAYAGKSYFFLQHGIFSAQQGADQAKSELQKLGLAAATEQSDKFYVFAGVTTDKDSATVLKNRLKDQSNIDIYSKAYAVPAVSKVRWNGNADTLKSYLEQSDKLVQSFSMLSSMNLETAGQASPIEASTLQSVTSSHTAWSKLATTVAQEGGDDNKAVIQRMNNAMNSAKASLDEYKKNPSQAMMWQAQTYALQFIIAEKELIARIGA